MVLEVCIISLPYGAGGVIVRREPNSEEEDSGMIAWLPFCKVWTTKKRVEEGGAKTMCKAKMLWTDV